MSNPTDAGSPWLLHEAVARQAAAHDVQHAIVSGDSGLTYRDLLENARSIAGRLRAAGAGKGAVVASCLPRGLALGPAVLGTWLAGGCYVPLDPDGPPKRRDFMLRDSGAAVIIAGDKNAAACGEGDRPVVVVDAAGAPVQARSRPPGGARQPSGARPPVTSADLAYLIYTSGSTGRPKGVMVEHGNLAAMARNHEATLYGGQGRDVQRVALNNVTLADSFFSDFVHLAYGRTLYVVDDLTRRDPDRLARFIKDHGIEVIDATPTQIQTVLLAGHADVLASLTVLVLGGEATGPALWQQLSRLPGVQPYNLYGPTECTVAVTAAAFRDHPSPMLGSPLPGCGVWIVDEELRPVPDGEAGELLVTGAQVVRGYLNPAAADAARFVSFRPPGGGQAVRGYRTGDRGRRDRAGQLEFLGRTDSQVSIAGHRVEIGEVETTLRGCAGVRAAAVGALRGEHVTALGAFVVLDQGTSIEDVRAQLAAMLPPHMIPVLTVVPRIPMGPTGKADFTGLARASAPGEQTPAKTAAEDSTGTADVAGIVGRIWCEMLNIAAVDSADDFFALGGDSVTATQVVVAIRETLAPDIPIRVLFEHPVFGEFCAAVGPYSRGGASLSGGPA